ncbi:hypothetical protein [Nitrospira sp. M1]
MASNKINGGNNVMKLLEYFLCNVLKKRGDCSAVDARLKVLQLELQHLAKNWMVLVPE